MIRNLNTKSLLFSDNRPEIVFKEKKSKYVGKNNGLKNIEGYRVDGILITDGRRCCDHCLALPADNILILVELKGCDLSYACTQILSTIDYLVSKNVKAVYKARIVLTRVSVPALEGVEFKKLRKKVRSLGGNVIKKTFLLEENI